MKAFLPGIIIAAIRLDYKGYALNIDKELVDLITELLGNRVDRAILASEIGNNNSIPASFAKLPEVQFVSFYLRKKFPEIAKFSDELGKVNLQDVFSNPESALKLLMTIHHKFKYLVEFNCLDDETYSSEMEAHRKALGELQIKQKAANFWALNEQIRKQRAAVAVNNTCGQMRSKL